MKLNRAKPFGQISGVYDEVPGAAFTQDGKFFDSKGELIDVSGSDLSEEPEAETEAEEESIESPDAGGETAEDAGEPEEVTEDGPVMDKTDEELQALADSGMAPLRAYALQFGIKGTSKSEIVGELQALRA